MSKTPLLLNSSTWRYANPWNTSYWILYFLFWFQGLIMAFTSSLPCLFIYSYIILSDMILKSHWPLYKIYSTHRLLDKLDVYFGVASSGRPVCGIMDPSPWFGTSLRWAAVTLYLTYLVSLIMWVDMLWKRSCYC